MSVQYQNFPLGFILKQIRSLYLRISGIYEVITYKILKMYPKFSPNQARNVRGLFYLFLKCFQNQKIIKQNSNNFFPFI